MEKQSLVYTQEEGGEFYKRGCAGCKKRIAKLAPYTAMYGSKLWARNDRYVHQR
jgi:hypothetical protein